MSSKRDTTRPLRQRNRRATAVPPLAPGRRIDDHDCLVIRGSARRARAALVLEPRYWLAALAILFVLFTPYQTLVQTVITDDAVRKGIEADSYDMTWVTVAYGVGVIYGVFAGMSVSLRIGKRFTLVLAMLVFCVGNILCGAANGLVALAFGRFVEGFGKMLAMAVGRATLYKQFDRALLVAIGFYGVFAYSTRHVTPLVNAYLDVYLSWRWMYWAYVPIGFDRCGLGLAVHPSRSTAQAPARADRLAGRHSFRGLGRGGHLCLLLVPQVGRLVIERVRRHRAPRHWSFCVPGRLARIGLQPRRAPEADPPVASLRPLPDDARADAPEYGGRTDDRRHVLHRVARLPTNHGGLADGANLCGDGGDHLPHNLVPPPVAAAPLGDRRLRGGGGLRMVVIVDRQFHA